MSNKLVSAITKDLTIRAYALDSAYLVNEAHRIHKTSPLASAALGRTLTASSMMGYMLKGPEDSVTVQFKGDGPLGTILAVSDSQGNPRGYLQHPGADLPLNPQGKLDVGKGVGKGTLSVIKDLQLKEPYCGQVPIVNGEIAEDITNYFAVSEQTPTVCALGVLVDVDYSIKAAGGFLLQLLPYAGEEAVSMLEESIKNIPPVTDMLSNGMGPEDILKRALSRFELEILEITDVDYVCTCSQKRVERALISLGRAELERLKEEQDITELTCQFCDNIYRFDRNQLEKLILSSK